MTQTTIQCAMRRSKEHLNVLPKVLKYVFKENFLFVKLLCNTLEVIVQRFGLLTEQFIQFIAILRSEFFKEAEINKHFWISSKFRN